MNEGKTLRRRGAGEDERAWPRVLAMLGGVLLLIIFGLLLLMYVVRKTHLGETGELRLTPAASVRARLRGKNTRFGAAGPPSLDSTVSFLRQEGATRQVEKIQTAPAPSFEDGWAGRGAPAARRNVAPRHRDPA